MEAVLHALRIAQSMTWEILWALIPGYALWAVVQAMVRRATLVRLVGDDRPRTDHSNGHTEHSDHDAQHHGTRDQDSPSVQCRRGPGDPPGDHRDPA